MFNDLTTTKGFGLSLGGTCSLTKWMQGNQIWGTMSNMDSRLSKPNQSSHLVLKHARTPGGILLSKLLFDFRTHAPPCEEIPWRSAYRRTDPKSIRGSATIPSKFFHPPTRPARQMRGLGLFAQPRTCRQGTPSRNPERSREIARDRDFKLEMEDVGCVLCYLCRCFAEFTSLS